MAPVFFRHALRRDESHRVVAPGFDLFAVHKELLDARSKGILNLDVNINAETPLHVAVHLFVRIGREGGFEIFLHHLPHLPPSQLRHGHRWIGRHDIPKIIYRDRAGRNRRAITPAVGERDRSEEHTSELQSRQYLVCRLLLEKSLMMSGTKARNRQQSQDEREKLNARIHVSVGGVFFNDAATTEIYTLSLHDALPIYARMYWRSPKVQLEVLMVSPAKPS